MTPKMPTSCGCRSWWCLIDSIQHRIRNKPFSRRACDHHDTHITAPFPPWLDEWDNPDDAVYDKEQWT